MVEPEPKDFTLLDSMIDNFFDTPKQDMLPVLCGYFKKIITNLIKNERDLMLNYLFVKNEGKILDQLADHIDNDSLAGLAYELLQTQVRPEP